MQGCVSPLRALAVPAFSQMKTNEIEKISIFLYCGVANRYLRLQKSPPNKNKEKVNGLLKTNNFIS